MGTGARVAKFIVAIAHEKGVIKCQQYEGNINGDIFSRFIDTHLPEMFLSGVNQKGKLFLQDEHPSQNCELSRESMDKVGFRLFKKPVRSPDPNPIENIFHLIGKQLRSDAMHKDITAETFEKFSSWHPQEIPCFLLHSSRAAMFFFLKVYSVFHVMTPSKVGIQLKFLCSTFFP